MMEKSRFSIKNITIFEKQALLKARIVLMRLKLIIFFCAISLSASAQFWQKATQLFKKKHPILSPIAYTNDNSIHQLSNHFKLTNLVIAPVNLNPSLYNLECTTLAILGMAKHNMRFRIYNLASYNFSDLAELYIKMARYSEAKWYLLQSNNLSRQANDDKHTVANLINLALIKTHLGDIKSAREDLIEARDISRAKGITYRLAEIDKKIMLLPQTIDSTPKPLTKYADATDNKKKKL